MRHTIRIHLLILLFALPLFAQAQESLKGLVLEVLDGQEVPLEGANVYWQDTSIGTITDEDGNVLSWASGGSAGFKGARESTPYAAQITSEQAVEKAKSLHGLETVDVYVKGIGVGREQAIRGLLSAGVELRAIYDVTPIPHNGCRKKKVRRM